MELADPDSPGKWPLSRGWKEFVLRLHLNSCVPVHRFTNYIFLAGDSLAAVRGSDLPAVTEISDSSGFGIYSQKNTQMWCYFASNILQNVRQNALNY